MFVLNNIRIHIPVNTSTSLSCNEPIVSIILIYLIQTKSGSVISSADWKLDPEELTRKFSDKTKAIFLNTPNNPLGKVRNILK